MKVFSSLELPLRALEKDGQYGVQSGASSYAVYLSCMFQNILDCLAPAILAPSLGGKAEVTWHGIAWARAAGRCFGDPNFLHGHHPLSVLMETDVSNAVPVSMTRR